MEPYPGADLGAYRIERKVGEGAFGAVWCASHTETGQRVAIKILLPAAAANPQQVSRFHREAKLLALVQSPNVAKMIDFVVDETFGVALVMELIDGELLSDRLVATTLSARQTLEIGVQIVDGMVDLHAVGIIHRDLKPNNVMLCTKGDGTRRVVIFDLGLSRLVRDAASGDSTRSLTGAHVALGTVECMAPEQILNAHDVTERSDVYSVGTILYRAMTGSFPFAAEDDREVARKKLTVETPAIALQGFDPVAEALRAIITKATKRRPAERYATSKELQRDLSLLVTQLKPAVTATVPPRRDPSRDRMPTFIIDEGPSPPSWRDRLVPVVVGIAVFCVLVGVALMWQARHP
jgi:eukaryotic-like serine/threonine-protein kinase